MSYEMVRFHQESFQWGYGPRFQSWTEKKDFLIGLMIRFLSFSQTEIVPVNAFKIALMLANTDSILHYC